MSAYPDTSSRPSSPAAGGGVDLPTLVITAVASAAAAYAASQVWAPGTLPAAAFTPVLVALIKEALAHSTKAVTRAVPVRGVVRSKSPSQPYEPPAPPPTERVAQQGEITYHSKGAGARRWRLAIVTGLLGFVVAALVFTVPELLAGRSASGGGGSTTLFGGQQERREEPTKTTTAPARTVTVPTPTVTVPAPAKTTTVPPAETTTVPVPPATTTPAPAPAAPTATVPPLVRPPG